MPRPAKLLEGPPAETLKGVRDRAILATLPYHGMRREELCRLRVRATESRRGVMHFRVKRKHDKIRFIPVHAQLSAFIEEYLAKGPVGHHPDSSVPLFRPATNHRTGELDRPLDPGMKPISPRSRSGSATRLD